MFIEGLGVSVLGRVKLKLLDCGRQTFKTKFKITRSKSKEECSFRRPVTSFHDVNSEFQMS